MLAIGITHASLIIQFLDYGVRVSNILDIHLIFRDNT